MTRTVFIGKEPSKEHAEIYNIVKNANEKAISIIKEGVRFSDIDKAARNLITDAGYGEYFTHRTGHSIGIEVHDFGNVSSVNDAEVKSGMIFSVEPGIYLKERCRVLRLKVRGRRFKTPPIYLMVCGKRKDWQLNERDYTIGVTVLDLP